LHLLCDGKGTPLVALLTPGQTHESTQFERLLNAVHICRPSGQVRKRPERLAADKGYDFPRIRRWLRMHGIQAVIPPRKRTGKPKAGRPVTYNKDYYRHRNVIERQVGWLKEHRSLATRYDKLAVNYLTLVHIAFMRRYLSLLTVA
jgi:transposase